MKRIFAIIMTICLMASVLSVPAFALKEAPTPTSPVLSVSVLKRDAEKPELVGEYYVFEDGWNAAIDLATSKEKLKAYKAERVVVDLLADWTAVDDDFGSGSGFDWSTIFIPGDTKITLNMNGHTIDRDLKTDDYDGEVIHVDEKADLIINGGKSGDPIIMPGQPAGDVKMGTITGGWSCNGAAGIFIDNYAKVELNNVNVVGNIADYDDGAGIGVYAGATLVMNGGSVSENVIKVDFALVSIYCGAGVLVEKATATLNGVTLENNMHNGIEHSTLLWGAAVYSKDSTVTLKNCLIKDNGLITEYVDEESDTDPDAPVEKTNSTIATVFGWGGTMVIENTDFIGNGVKDTWGHHQATYYTVLIDIENVEFTMTGGKVTGNNQVFLLDIYDSTVNVNGVDFTGNESLAMSKGDDLLKTSTFTNCKFSAGTPYGDYNHDFRFKGSKPKITFVDCDFGEATFNNKSAAKFENTANGVGSLFGEGSLTNILVIISLVISVAAICLAIASHKKKAVLATANEAEKSE